MAATGMMRCAVLSALAFCVLSFGSVAQAQLTLEIPEAEFEAAEDYKPIPTPGASGGPVNQFFESMDLDMTGTLPEAVLESMLGETPYDFVDVVWGMEVTGDWTDQQTGTGTLQVTDFTEGRGATMRIDPERYTGLRGFHMYNARLQTDGEHSFTLSAAFPPDQGGVAFGTELDGVKGLFEVTWLCHMFEPGRTGCIDYPDEYYETDVPVLSKLHILRMSRGYRIEFAARVHELRTHRDRGYSITEPSGRFADVRGWVCDRASWEEDPEVCTAPEPLKLTSISPPHRRENVHLETPQIEIEFNFSVAADKLDENFSLTTRDMRGETVEMTGRIVPVSDTQLRFEPDDDLESGVIYEARIEGGEDGVQSRDGATLTGAAHWWRFSTLVDLDNHDGPVDEPVRTHVYQTVRDVPLVVHKPALQRIYVDWGDQRDHPMRSALKTIGGAVLLSLYAACAPGDAAAQFDGYGPDAWQVTGFASDDWLNLRMGPGARYAIIGSFPARATGLTMTTCVPFMSQGQGIMLSQAERDLLDLPPRWCLMSDGHTHGWAAARFLMEASASATPVRDGDSMLAEAISLVKRLYARHEQAMRAEALAPLGASRSRDFFMVETAEDLASLQWQADPLYDAQDADISDLRVVPDTDQPMLRGMITVRAEFLNFGQPQSVIFNLRADTGQPGAPVRIMRIIHGARSIP